MGYRGALTVLLLLFPLPVGAAALASVLAVQGPAGAGVGFCIGDGSTLVTAERIGGSVTVDGTAATLLVARAGRGISLWRLEQPREPLTLAESALITRDVDHYFLSPTPVKVSDLRLTSDASRWQLRSEVWVAEAETDAPVALGSPLVRGSDGAVVGMAVAADGPAVAVATANGIRLTCFDAGVSLGTPTPEDRGAKIVASWPFGGDTASEFSHGEAVRLEAWRDIAGLLPTYQSSLVAAGSLLYLGDRHGNVYCVDTERRSLVWSQTLEAPVIFPPVVDGDSVYVTVFGLLLEMKDNTVLWRNRHWYASGISYLYAFNRHTGEVQWRHVTGLRTPSIIHEGRVYFGGLNGFGALDASNGSSVWLKGEPLGRHEAPSWYILCPPADGVLPVFQLQLRLYEKEPRRTLRVCGTASLLLVDPDTGDARTSVRFGQLPTSDHPFATACYMSADRSHAVIAVGTSIRSYHLPDGKLLWDQSLPGALLPGSVCESDRLFLPNDAPALHCVQAATGTREWSFTKLAGPPGSLLLHQGNVYLGTLGGSLYALSGGTGTQQWALECPGGRISGAPAVIGDTLYAAASDGRIYAVTPVSGREAVGVRPPSG